MKPRGGRNVKLTESFLPIVMSSVVLELSIVTCTVSPGPSRLFAVLLTFSILVIMKLSEVMCSILFGVFICMTVSPRLIPSDPG